MSSSVASDTNDDGVQQTLARLNTSVKNHSAVLEECFDRISALEKKEHGRRRAGDNGSDSVASSTDSNPPGPPSASLTAAISSLSRESLIELVSLLCHSSNEAHQFTASRLLDSEAQGSTTSASHSTHGRWDFSEDELKLIRACKDCNLLFNVDRELSYEPSRFHPGTIQIEDDLWEKEYWDCCFMGKQNHGCKCTQHDARFLPAVKDTPDEPHALKRKSPTKSQHIQTCKNCEELFNVNNTRRLGECSHHRGIKQRGWDDDEFKAANYWNCCNRKEGSDGCEATKHQAEEASNKRVKR